MHGRTVRRTAATSNPHVERSGRRALLIQREYAGERAAQFIPAHPGARCGGDRVVHHQGVVIAKVTVRQAVHQAIAERIEQLCGSGLGNDAQVCVVENIENPRAEPGA